VEFRSKLTSTIVSFLREVGLSVASGNVDDETFLPGIQVVAGGLVVDEAKLKHPGDLLHEAGHLAVTPLATRADLNGQVEAPDANADIIEAAAICWSYAASLYLDIDPKAVFHDDGYRGRPQNLLLNFRLGVFPGVHELVSAGMTQTGINSDDADSSPFPAMKKWLRD